MKMIRRSLSLLDLPATLKIWEWAERNRRMGKNVTAKPGRYSIATAPYQREPQESFTDPEVQTTVLYWAKRLGKTEMINNLHGWVIECLQLNILVVYPTLDSAKKWSKQFFMPMVRTTQCLTRLLKRQRSRDSANTILSKEFEGGSTISAIGTNSVSGYRQVQAPVVTCDEIDAMEDGPEGDPITLSFGRAENYQNNIQVVASTATEVVPPREGQTGTGSRIHDWWLKSDQRKWFVPCGCGAWHVLAWSNVKWPKKENGEHELEKAYYETPCCGAKWHDYDRLKAIIAGEWRATAPFKGIRGYWLNGLNTVFPHKKGYKTKLHQFAGEFYHAYTSGEAARISWKNTFLCEPHEQTAEKIDASPLLERCEDYSPQKLPNEIAVITAAVDVQGDRLEVEAVGIGDSEESWGVEYLKLIGDPEKDEVWNDLKNALSKKYQRADGTELSISCCVIDLGHCPGRVRKFIKACGLPRVYGVYGARGKQVNLVTAKHNKFYKMFSYSVNTVLAKDTIFARLKLKDMGARYMHFPVSYERDYFDGLTAEEVHVKYPHGFPERFYEKVRARNEPLDLRVYWLAALDILRPNIAAIRKSLVRPEQPAKDYILKPEEVKQLEQKPKPRKRLSMRIPGLARF
jgi:phage terminase large subunit GpA-like protein